MQLIQIAQNMSSIHTERPNWDDYKKSVSMLLDTINNQQSEELKDLDDNYLPKSEQLKVIE